MVLRIFKIQNECHQWLSDSFRVYQIRFRPGLCPGPRWGSFQRSPDLLADLNGPTSKAKERGDGKRKMEGEIGEEGKGGEQGTGPPFANSWIRP